MKRSAEMAPPASPTMSSALMSFLRSVSFQVQPSVALQRRPDSLPIEPGLKSDVAQRQHHAFLHRLEAADVEIGVRIGDERSQIGPALTHHILDVALGLPGRAGKGAC